ncbi:unnamed protein product [Urochloa humidicola]
MVLGLGGCCGSVTITDGRKVSPAKHAAEGEGHPEAKKQQQRVVKEKVKGDALAEIVAGKERKKRDYKKDPPIIVHQFPFHSRPGLL